MKVPPFRLLPHEPKQKHVQLWLWRHVSLATKGPPAQRAKPLAQQSKFLSAFGWEKPCGWNKQGPPNNNVRVCPGAVRLEPSEGELSRTVLKGACAATARAYPASGGVAKTQISVFPPGGASGGQLMFGARWQARTASRLLSRAFKRWGVTPSRRNGYG